MDVKLSVRNLVEFICRCGDISDSSSGTLSKEAMNAGSRIHRKLQKKAGSYYNAEVPLEYAYESGDYRIITSGRADGIIEYEDSVTIDEIKGVYKKLSDITEPIYVHKAQAMCYAYIYSKQNELSEIKVQMTYVNLDSEEVKYFEEVFSFEYLEKWYLEVGILCCRAWYIT